MYPITRHDHSLPLSRPARAIPPKRAQRPPSVLRRFADSAGISFDGNQPWDIQVHDGALYGRLLRQGSLALGETYMEGLWDSARLDETMTRLVRANAGAQVGGLAGLGRTLSRWRNRLVNRQGRQRAFQVAERHYDIGNDLYEAMLDPSMSYSCGYWRDADTLDAAQDRKLRLICRKLELSPGERLLDIGCGWGGLAALASREFGVEVVGITISREQQTLALERCRGLPVTIRLMHYRDLEGRFDKVVSVGMFEHVGPKNYPRYFRTVANVLTDRGLMLLHTIGDRCTGHDTDPWIDRYIFPNGAIPSARQVTTAIEPWFIIEDWHNFGSDYDRTLMAWWNNFEAAWPSLDRERYNQRFYRLWKYYLHACAGYFRSRQGQLWQLVLSKPQRPGVYQSVR